MQEPLLNNLFCLLSVGKFLVGLSYLLLCNKTPKQSGLKQQPTFSLLMNLHSFRPGLAGTAPLGGIWGHLKARGDLLPGGWN